MTSPNIDTVRKLSNRYSNWGRWGDDDEIGTLNHVQPEHVTRAGGLIRAGKRISLGLPFDQEGPQTGGFGRFNPIHSMIRDGADVIAGTTIRDFYGGNDRYLRGTDDMITMPLQCGTQWDSLAHIIFEERMYNGYSADLVSSKGAHKNHVGKMADVVAGRGVLLDVARYKGVDALKPGYTITTEDLENTAAANGVEVGTGDFVMVRTGMMGERRGNWGDYAGGSAPGLGLEAVPFVAEREVAAVATDTWGMEVLPNETADVFQPLHIILIVHVGLLVGEIFDFEALAADCAEDGIYEFFFCAPPLPITRAVGSPINPMAIK
ncbi:MAG: cyclase family protein [Propionibacteriales bacterium]|nr:cyclase family protein [Propionibacteriales bacterium]